MWHKSLKRLGNAFDLLNDSPLFTVYTKAVFTLVREVKKRGSNCVSGKLSPSSVKYQIKNKSDNWSQVCAAQQRVHRKKKIKAENNDAGCEWTAIRSCLLAARKWYCRMGWIINELTSFTSTKYFDCKIVIEAYDALVFYSYQRWYTEDNRGWKQKQDKIHKHT